ncbi:MAG: bifunctional DNA primase/polymerase, partial [Fimbriimonadaceae bacterium]
MLLSNARSCNHQVHGEKQLSLERALNWSRHGWPVFPCNSNGHPAIKEWQKKATTDEAIIRAWDWEDKRVAAVPGLAGCFVIDVDVKNGKDGEASLAKLEAEHGFEAWEYPQQETPTGGRHLFLLGQAPSSVQRLLGEGLDTRGGTGEGGLGFVYVYGDGPPCRADDCLAAPESLVRHLGQGRREVSEDRETPRVELDQPANVERALSYIRNLPSPDEGQRNISVFKTACTLKDLGLSLAKIFEVLEDHPSVTGTPPLCEDNEEEFNATVRSAYKNGQRQPGIDAIDEEARNAAAEGFDLGEAREQAPHGRVRKRFTRWAEERDRDPPPWLIRGLLPKVSLVGMYAPGG